MERSELFVAVTSDAGHDGSWSSSRLALCASWGGPFSLPCAQLLNIVTASTWVVALGRSVYETSDGGGLDCVGSGLSSRAGH